MTPPQETKRHKPLWASVLINLLAAVIVIALFQNFVAKVYQVPSGSMEQTLDVGDRIVVNRLNASSYMPRNNDVVVFNSAEPRDEIVPAAEESLVKRVVKTFGDLTGIGPSHDSSMVKRIVGAPGDVVECCTSGTGGLTRNGELVEEPYVFQDLDFVPGQLDCSSTPRSQRCFAPITVPSGKYLVLGDHRSNSSDGVSRCRGLEFASTPDCARFVDRDDIVGPVGAVIWPFQHWKSF